jgi:hypothetical protein
VNDDKHSDFELRTKRAFDDSVTALDASTRSRLTQARHRALEELAPHRRQGWRTSLLPAGAVAATAFAAWLIVSQPPSDPADVQAAQLGDLEILLGEEDLEMLDEELEFYSWLEEQPEFADAGDSVG